MSHSIFIAIILGFVQGLGEFLPISSTAHLVLVPYFFRLPDWGLAFDVALHLGTFIALVAYFGKSWWHLIYTGLGGGKEKKKIQESRRLVMLVLVATIPAAILGKLFEEQAETIFRSPLIIAFTLFSFGGLLYVVDKWGKINKDEKNLTFWDSLIIGIFQALAIIPGVSRSGATITAGRMRGANRVAAANFSFLISAPIIFGAVILKLPDLWQASLTAELFWGTLASAISGYLAIKYLLRWLKSNNYEIFFWYRLALAIIIIIVFFCR